LIGGITLKEIKIGDKEVKIKATPLALLFYKQEFSTDLVGDLVAFKDLKEDISKINLLVVLQMTWAMAKAEHFGNEGSFSSFEVWLSKFEQVDFTDKDFLVAVLEEATDGFFHGSTGQIKQLSKSRE
jgi:hypothetical protein